MNDPDAAAASRDEVRPAVGREPRLLRVRGARAHNLTGVDVDLPREQLIVVTGPSGSGKSSLAFDTIYAEGQRRYVESLSAYARQFLDRLPKPDVDSIEGLSPAISIEQKAPSRNPRSTVGTVTEIYDHLRLLFARVGDVHCPVCDRLIVAHTVQRMVDDVLDEPDGTRLSVLSPVVRDRAGSHRDVLARFRKEGFVRVRVDGELRDLGDEIALDARRRHTIELVVDRLSVKGEVRQRLTEAVELAAGLAEGLVRIVFAEGEERLYSERFACPDHDFVMPELSPATFSFNSPQGACPRCGGLGEVLRFDPERVLPEPSRSVADGAVAPWGKAGGPYHRQMLESLAKRAPGFPSGTPVASLSREDRALLLDGGDAWEGVLPGLDRRLRDYERRRREDSGGDRAAERTAEFLEEELGRFAVRLPCDACGGARLRPEALAVRVGSRTIRELAGLPIAGVVDVLDGLELTGRAAAVGERILRELRGRLRFLLDVGLDYLSLDRKTATLSGGEAERIRLATQIGSGLTGVLYVLDEPSVGLHPRDNARLLDTLRALRDRGNTVVVVEHDEDTIRAADYLVDLGPGAGRAGGRVVAQGTPGEVIAHPDSLTGAFLSGRRAIPVPRERRRPTGWVRLEGVRLHNLADLTCEIPLGVLCCVTGVSGSGKSSLVVDTLVPVVRAHLRSGGGRPGAGAKAEREGEPPDGEGDARPELAEVRVAGLDALEAIVAIDQAPIGRTPRSNPASYVGLLTPVRELFATLPEARARGYKPGRFSFNVKGGRCESCQGDGTVRVEMHFLPDVFVECEVCGGRRYNRETLEVRYRGLSIADVLELTVDEAFDVFEAFPKIRSRLQGLREVGLGYLHLGQSAPTLSGGEAQRVKLARELSRRARSKTLYVLDEPTTGLHVADVEVLLEALRRLIRDGASVVVIEHDLDVVKSADWVIDLGPEGGDRGGHLVVVGVPETVSQDPASHTGRHLAEKLTRDAARSSPRRHVPRGTG